MLGLAARGGALTTSPKCDLDEARQDVQAGPPILSRRKAVRSGRPVIVAARHGARQASGRHVADQDYELPVERLLSLKKRQEKCFIVCWHQGHTFRIWRERRG